MNRVQLIAIAVAILCGGAAFLFVNQMSDTPPPVIQIAPKSEVEKVLVARNDLPRGWMLSDADTEWIDWPKEAVPQGAIARSVSPNAQEEIRNAQVFAQFARGEPMRLERISKGASGGVMATMLPPGKKALAVDVSLSSTAGGFILPEDRVDVLRVFRDPDGSRETGRDVFLTELVLSNMRVLAIGQTIEKKNSEPVVTGSTATLEVDPRQADALLIAQRTGQLILLLRSMRDAAAKNGPADIPPKPQTDDSLTIVKYGIPTNIRAK